MRRRVRQWPRQFQRRRQNGRRECLSANYFFLQKKYGLSWQDFAPPVGHAGLGGAWNTAAKRGGITFFGLARRRILGLHAHAKAATEAMLPSESQSSLGSPRTVHCPYLSRMCWLTA